MPQCTICSGLCGPMGSTPLVKHPGALQSIVILTIQTSFQMPTKPNRWLVPPFLFFFFVYLVPCNSQKRWREKKKCNHHHYKEPTADLYSKQFIFCSFFFSLLYFLLSFSPTVVCTFQLPCSFLKFPHIPSSYCLFPLQPNKKYDSSNQRNKRERTKSFIFKDFGCFLGLNTPQLNFLNE